jgi:hypothetical protein
MSQPVVEIVVVKSYVCQNKVDDERARERDPKTDAACVDNWVMVGTIGIARWFRCREEDKSIFHKPIPLLDTLNNLRSPSQA